MCTNIVGRYIDEVYKCMNEELCCYPSVESGSLRTRSFMKIRRTTHTIRTGSAKMRQAIARPFLTATIPLCFSQMLEFGILSYPSSSVKSGVKNLAVWPPFMGSEKVCLHGVTEHVCEQWCTHHYILSIPRVQERERQPQLYKLLKYQM